MPANEDGHNPRSGQETQNPVRRTALRHAFLRSRISVTCMQMNLV
jgi:hypothetical protein